MTGYHSFIGYPWIIDCLGKYDHTGGKQKPVPGQVVEFLRMPDDSENSSYPEAIINISDQKYYIRAVITKEAQQMLEREDEHFTLVDIKNKMIILKKFSVCFTAVEDLRNCEFYLTVQHFSVLPMETNTVDILNCNMEPVVRKKIKELWQAYMTELEMNEASHDMSLSDGSLTQLLMVASEEKFNALKSVAEQCLDLDPFAIQDTPPQGKTLWSIERKRNQENTEQFVIPMDLLQIPPHEKGVLEQVTEGRSEGQCISEIADSSEGENSSQPYSTALSTFSEEAVEEGTSTQSGNPWNKLQSLCVSVATSSDSQPKCSPLVNELGSDPDSSTPDIFTPNAGASTDDSPNGKSEISPLMFSDHFSNPQQPSTSVAQSDSASNDTSPNHRQGSDPNSSIASLNLIPLTQDSVKDSFQRHLSVSSAIRISPRKSRISEIRSSPVNEEDLFFLSDESHRENEMINRTKKAWKRKQMLEVVESPPSDLEQQEHEYVEILDSMTNTASSGEEIDKTSDIDSGLHGPVSNQIQETEPAIPVSVMEEGNKMMAQFSNTHTAQNHKYSRKRIQAHKSTLQFVVGPKNPATKDSSDKPKLSKVCIQEAPSKATPGHPYFQEREKSIVPFMEAAKAKLVHYDGTPFQYKYKSPAEDLFVHMKTIQIPADLCEWAVKMLSEGEEKVL